MLSTRLAEPPIYSAPALEKGLDILELLAEQKHGLTQSQIAHKLCRSSSEIFRMLYCLEQRRYLRRASDQRYILTSRLYHLFSVHSPTAEWVRLAQPHMQKLSDAFRSSCQLSVLERNQLVVVARSLDGGDGAFRPSLGDGRHLLDCDAGKLVAAYLPALRRDWLWEEWRAQHGVELPDRPDMRTKDFERKRICRSRNAEMPFLYEISAPVFKCTRNVIGVLTLHYDTRGQHSPAFETIEIVVLRHATQISEAISLTCKEFL